MIISVFKNNNIFESLVKYNKELRDVYYINTTEKQRESEWWFNPDRVEDNPIAIGFDGSNKAMSQKNLPCNKSLYQLALYAPNYLAILLVSILYKDNKNILIEDASTGMGKMPFFLSKLGFNNFSLSDNFSQIRQSLLEAVLKTGDIEYTLNNTHNVNPIIINICGFTTYYPEHTPIPDSVELFCHYSNKTLSEQVKQLLLKNTQKYVELCVDNNFISKAYCREDKYLEFAEKLKPYEQ